MSRKSRTGIPYTYVGFAKLNPFYFYILTVSLCFKARFWIWKTLSLEPSGYHQIQEFCTFQDRSFDDPMCQGRFCNITISSEFNKAVSWVWRVKWVQGIVLLMVTPVGVGVYLCCFPYLSLHSSKWYLTDSSWRNTHSWAERVRICCCRSFLVSLGSCSQLGSISFLFQGAGADLGRIKSSKTSYKEMISIVNLSSVDLCYQSPNQPWLLIGSCSDVKVLSR